MTSLPLRSQIRQITWFYFSAVERVEAKEQTRKVAFFPRHSLKHKHHSSLYIPQWHTPMEKQSRPTCLPSVNPMLHPAWHQECTAAGLGWAGTATQPSAGCKGTRATSSCFSSSTCWKQLEQTWHQAFTPSETRKGKSCFSRASSAAQRLCCSYSLVIPQCCHCCCNINHSSLQTKYSCTFLSLPLQTKAPKYIRVEIRLSMLWFWLQVLWRL